MDVLKDKRFSGVVKDSRFKRIPTKHTKTKIDKRFHGLFNDKEFELKYMVNKRGSPLDHKISEDYRKFYQLDNGQDIKAENVSRTEVGSKCENDSSEESDDEKEDTKAGVALEEPKSSSDEDGSTTTDTETSDNEQEEEIDHHWQELDADAPLATNITQRLAVCNMDWDRLKAEDFSVVFNSFKPPTGIIHSIKIYPSEYGLERMEKEKLHGPAELIEEKLDSDEDNAASGTKGSCFHREKLRQYQINRLKYFFAVVDCDSPETADVLYGHLNGMEFESSGCILDLRFIPDDMTFEQEPVSVASAVSSQSDFKPSYFKTSALNQIKVDLTWDITDPKREEVLKRAFTSDPESIDKDIRQYLASGSESEDDVEELQHTCTQKLSTKAAIAKYKALVQALEEKEKGKQKEDECDMEITWEAGLKEKTEKLVKEKTTKENLTPFEEELQKKKELKKLKKEKRMNPQKEDNDNSSSEESEVGNEEEETALKRKVLKRKNKFKSKEDSEVDEKKMAELALLVAEPNEQNSSDSDGSRRKKKKKNIKKMKKEDSLMFQEHVDDPRFSAIYTDPKFHVDPSFQNLKERKKPQAFTEVTQRAKCVNPNQASCKISEKEIYLMEGLKEETKKSIEVEDLKKKVGKFCKEFQKEKELKKQKKQRNRGVQKVDVDQMPLNKAAYPLNGTTKSATYLGDSDEDSEMSIFSSGPTKRKAAVKKTTHHVNPIQKKIKKTCRAS